MPIEAIESDELKSILNEIETLKSLNSKSDYVINYLDSFSSEVLILDEAHIVYHVVNNLYKVINFLFFFN